MRPSLPAPSLAGAVDALREARRSRPACPSPGSPESAAAARGGSSWESHFTPLRDSTLAAGSGLGSRRLPSAGPGTTPDGASGVPPPRSPGRPRRRPRGHGVSAPQLQRLHRPGLGQVPQRLPVVLVLQRVQVQQKPLGLFDLFRCPLWKVCEWPCKKTL